MKLTNIISALVGSTISARLFGGTEKNQNGEYHTHQYGKHVEEFTMVLGDEPESTLVEDTM